MSSTQIKGIKHYLIHVQIFVLRQSADKIGIASDSAAMQISAVPVGDRIVRVASGMWVFVADVCVWQNG